MARAVGGDPRPRVPAPPFEPAPAERTSQRRRSFSSRATASVQDTARPASARRNGRHAQHVPLPALLKVLTQFGATAVHLVTAHEVEGPRRRRRPAARRWPTAPWYGTPGPAAGRRPSGGRVADLPGRDPLARPDQRVPGPLTYIRQVHRVDPVGHPAGAPQVLALDPGRLGSLLLLAGLVQRRDTHARPGAGRRAALQPRHREPAHPAHRRPLIPRRPVEQPLRAVRRPVSDLLGDRPPVALGQVADQRVTYLPRAARSRACEARAQRPHQFDPRPPGVTARYPGDGSRLRFCCPHTHMIAGRLPPCAQNPHV